MFALLALPAPAFAQADPLLESALNHSRAMLGQADR
jgi:hypothetical protein